MVGILLTPVAKKPETGPLQLDSTQKYSTGPKLHFSCWILSEPAISVEAGDFNRPAGAGPIKPLQQMLIFKKMFNCKICMLNRMVGLFKWFVFNFSCKGI